MSGNTRQLWSSWLEARSRYENILHTIVDKDLSKRVAPIPNSVGYLIRHIADVELLFAKNIFGATELKVTARTVIDQKDSGQWIHLEDLLDISKEAKDRLSEAILSQNETTWTDTISTKEFGEKTKAAALGRIISHTAYHAGQIGIIQKYGNI